MKKTYIGISRDHSGSMESLKRAAMADYNNTIITLRDASLAAGQDTIVSVVECRSTVTRSVVNSSVNSITPITSYQTYGMTALFDSVGELITMLEAVPDASDPEVAFLIMVITDGEENVSSQWNSYRLMQKIQRLQATDRWTFVFRVPRGQSRVLTNFGVPAGNILEWDQSERGVHESSTATAQAFRGFYDSRAAGATSTTKFYANMADVSIKDVKKSLTDISPYVNLWTVDQRDAIRPFCERKSGKPFIKGAAFYQLTKTEDAVQDYKQVVVRHKPTGAIYGGPNARAILNLPTTGTIRVHPGDHGDYEIFLQSTSVNRALPAGTQLLYWPTYNQPVQSKATAPKATAPKATAPKATAPKATAPKATAPLGSNLHSSLYIKGYKEGFEVGKAKNPHMIADNQSDYNKGFLAGYKDGRGKKKRIYK